LLARSIINIRITVIPVTSTPRLPIFKAHYNLKFYGNKILLNESDLAGDMKTIRSELGTLIGLTFAVTVSPSKIGFVGGSKVAVKISHPHTKSANKINIIPVFIFIALYRKMLFGLLDANK
jgi:hypothetical protein